MTEVKNKGDEWCRCYSLKKNMIYYFNCKTKVSYWPQHCQELIHKPNVVIIDKTEAMRNGETIIFNEITPSAPETKSEKAEGSDESEDDDFENAVNAFHEESSSSSIFNGSRGSMTKEEISVESRLSDHLLKHDGPEEATVRRRSMEIGPPGLEVNPRPCGSRSSDTSSGSVPYMRPGPSTEPSDPQHRLTRNALLKPRGRFNTPIQDRKLKEREESAKQVQLNEKELINQRQHKAKEEPSKQRKLKGNEEVSKQSQKNSGSHAQNLPNRSSAKTEAPSPDPGYVSDNSRKANLKNFVIPKRKVPTEPSKESGTGSVLDPPQLPTTPQVPSRLPQLPSRGHQDSLRGSQASSREPQATSRVPQASLRGSQASSREPQATSRIPQASLRGSQASSRGPQASTRGPQASSRRPQASSRGPQVSSKGPQASLRESPRRLLRSHQVPQQANETVTSNPQTSAMPNTSENWVQKVWVSPPPVLAQQAAALGTVPSTSSALPQLPGPSFEPQQLPSKTNASRPPLLPTASSYLRDQETPTLFKDPIPVIRRRVIRSPSKAEVTNQPPNFNLATVARPVTGECKAPSPISFEDTEMPDDDDDDDNEDHDVSLAATKRRFRMDDSDNSDSDDSDTANFKRTKTNSESGSSFRSSTLASRAERFGRHPTAIRRPSFGPSVSGPPSNSSNTSLIDTVNFKRTKTNSESGSSLASRAERFGLHPTATRAPSFEPSTSAPPSCSSNPPPCGPVNFKRHITNSEVQSGASFVTSTPASQADRFGPAPSVSTIAPLDSASSAPASMKPPNFGPVNFKRHITNSEVQSGTSFVTSTPASQADRFGPAPSVSTIAPLDSASSAAASMKPPYFDARQIIDKRRQTGESAKPASNCGVEPMDWEPDSSQERQSQQLAQQKNLLLMDLTYKPLILVSDTNAFIHHIDLVHQLIEGSYLGMVTTLVLPYQCFRELDSMKERLEVSMAARTAIRLINEVTHGNALSPDYSLVLQDNRMHRIKATEHLDLDKNDNYILNCALQQKKECGDSSIVLLLTADKHLLSHSSILDVISQSPENLRSWIRGYKECVRRAAITGDMDIIENYLNPKKKKKTGDMAMEVDSELDKNQLENLSEHKWDIKTFAEYFTEDLKQLLRCVIEKCNENLYEGLKDLASQPQKSWTLSKYLTEINRRWGTITNRRKLPKTQENIKRIIELVRKSSAREGSGLGEDDFSISDMKSLFSCCKILAEEFLENYRDNATIFLTRVDMLSEELDQKCKKSRSSSPVDEIQPAYMALQSIHYYMDADFIELKETMERSNKQDSDKHVFQEGLRSFYNKVTNIVRIIRSGLDDIPQSELKVNDEPISNFLKETVAFKSERGHILTFDLTRENILVLFKQDKLREGVKVMFEKFMRLQSDVNDLLEDLISSESDLDFDI